MTGAIITERSPVTGRTRPTRRTHQRRYRSHVRIDRLDIPIEIVDAEAAASPGRAPARWTREGYLLVDAFIARDGPLEYSDGRERWIEYRPLAELEHAAATFGSGTPITDGHPDRMVTSATYRDVARGVQIGDTYVSDPDPATGYSYLGARLLIQDEQLLARVDAGVREISIGFFTDVVPATEEHTDAIEAGASHLQTNMVGNHIAVLPRGRSGPGARLMMDGAPVPVYHPHKDSSVTIKNTPPGTPAPKYDASFAAACAVTFARWASARKDEIGSPTTMVPTVGPDGAITQLPAWAAAVIGEWRIMKAAERAAPAEPEAGPDVGDPLPAPPAMPTAPEADAPETPPAAPAPGPAPAPGEPDEEKDDEEKEMTKDELNVLMKARGRLTRLATEAGVSAATIDSADQDDLARAFVAAKCPHLAAKVKDATGERLDAFVDIAEEYTPANPFEAGVRKRKDEAEVTIDENDPELRFLAAQGYC